MAGNLTPLLRATSRSFYLTLRVLPRAIRPQIGLAYLLARTSDTIADTELVPLDQRLAALQQLRERILGRTTTPLNFGGLAQHQASPAEKALLETAEDSLSALEKFSEADRKLIREVLAIITSGQELDLNRFASGRAGTPLPAAERRAAESAPYQIISLATDSELDDYTYRVAGCVGEFWTRMCRAHLFPDAKLNDSYRTEFGQRDAGIEKFFKQLDDSYLIQLGISFGKGLQLVNILRDLPADLRKGRCYLPADALAAAGLTPADLLSPASEGKFRPLYHRHLDLAESHLAAGWQYTNLIPFAWWRVRLACAWPILIGVKTIQRLRVANVLDPQQRVKISRREVRQIILGSVLRYPWPPAWRRMVTPPAAVAGRGAARRA